MFASQVHMGRLGIRPAGRPLCSFLFAGTRKLLIFQRSASVLRLPSSESYFVPRRIFAAIVIVAITASPSATTAALATAVNVLVTTTLA